MEKGKKSGSREEALEKCRLEEDLRGRKGNKKSGIECKFGGGTDGEGRKVERSE